MEGFRLWETDWSADLVRVLVLLNSCRCRAWTSSEQRSPRNFKWPHLNLNHFITSRLGTSSATQRTRALPHPPQWPRASAISMPLGLLPNKESLHQPWWDCPILSNCPSDPRSVAIESAVLIPPLKLHLLPSGSKTTTIQALTALCLLIMQVIAASLMLIISANRMGATATARGSKHLPLQC